MSASASANAMPRNIVVRTVRLHLGLARHRLDGVADDEADADARADGREAVADGPEAALQLVGPIGGLCLCEELDDGPHGCSLLVSGRGCEIGDWVRSVLGVHGLGDVHRRQDREDVGLQDARRGSRSR